MPFVGGAAPPTAMPTPSRPGTAPPPLPPHDGLGRRSHPGPGPSLPGPARDILAPPPAGGTGVEDGSHDRGRTTQEGDTLLLDPREDLLAVDLALHDLGASHGRH